MIKIVYAIVLGFLIAVFIGFGVEVFYPSEKYPETPKEIRQPLDTSAGENYLVDQQKIQNEYDKATKEFEERSKRHSRNTSLIIISFAIIFMAVSLIVESKKLAVFTEGLLISSLLMLMYGIIRGFELDSNTFRFGLISVGLAAAVFLGWWKFINRTEN